jgi:PAS domain S-box-containing protein
MTRGQRSHSILPTRGDAEQCDPRVGTRVQAFVQGAELGPVADTLTASRHAILGRWLEAARRQPFHAAQPERAVADHIPHLFDALVAFLRRHAPREVDPSSPLDDAAVRAAAQAHASDRFRQGLAAADVLTEFRLLRQEIGRALRERTDGAGDVLAAELLVHDALDGATTLGVAALEMHAGEYHRASAELAAIVESSYDSIIGKTLEGIITSWNPGAERLYGHTAAEAVGQPMSLIIPPDRPDELPTILARVRRGERVEPYETVRVRKDGSRIEVSVTVSPIRDPSGAVVGASAIARDITERKQAEEALRVRSELLQEAVRLREELLALVAHDLKGPLTAIKGTADLLQRQAAAGRLAPDRLSDRLATISQTATTMAAQIGELLDAARLRAGQPLELDRHPTDLMGLIHRVVAQVQQTTTGHTIDVQAAVPELIGNWDAPRLERVLGNLLGNAVKYSPAGGDVSVEVGHEEDGGQAWVCVAVRDRGVGIPAADLPHIFEPYHRAANVAGRFPGEGIGLAGARQIIEQHGGRIHVESEEGQGSTFTIQLPLQPQG